MNSIFKKICISSDHAGYQLKEQIIAFGGEESPGASTATETWNGSAWINAAGNVASIDTDQVEALAYVYNLILD